MERLMKKIVIISYIITLSLSLNLCGMKQFSKNTFNKSKNIISKNIFKNNWRNYTVWDRVKNYVTSKLFNKNISNVPIETYKNREQIPIIKEEFGDTTPTIKQSLQQKFSPNLPQYIQDKIAAMIKKWKLLAVKIADNLFFKATPLERTYTPLKKTTNFARTKFHHAKQQGAFGSWSLNPVSQTPRHFAARTYSHLAKGFDYTLDGENANLTPKEFVQKLHEEGLTVADVIYKTCEKEEQKTYEEMKKLGILNDSDWKYLANILKVRNTILKEHGHYHENNITFKKGIESRIAKMIKEVFKRADLPFKVTVNLDPLLTSVAKINIGSHVYEDIHLNIKEEFDWKNFLLNPSHNSIINFNLYLGPKFFEEPSWNQKFILAHETTHLLNLHALQIQLFIKYFDKAKIHMEGQTWFLNNIEMQADKVMELVQKHVNFHTKIHEIQADLLPLIYQDYAKGAWILYCFDNRKDELYIPGNQMYEFAKRAAQLHDAEQELLGTKK